MKAKLKVISIMAVCFCALSFCAPLAQGTLITIEIEAVVDFVEDRGNYLEGKIKPGDIITGSYTYDSSTPDQDWLWGSESDVVGRYHYFNQPYGISLTVDEFVFQTNPDSVNFLVSIVNDNQSGNDVYAVGSSSNLPLSNSTVVDSISWTLKDHTGSVFSSDALPTTAPVLVDWQENILRFGSDRRYGIFAHVTSAVPEPATIILMCMGGLLISRRNTQKT